MRSRFRQNDNFFFFFFKCDGLTLTEGGLVSTVSTVPHVKVYIKGRAYISHNATASDLQAEKKISEEIKFLSSGKIPDC